MANIRSIQLATYAVLRLDGLQGVDKASANGIVADRATQGIGFPMREDMLSGVSSPSCGSLDSVVPEVASIGVVGASSPRPFCRIVRSTPVKYCIRCYSHCHDWEGNITNFNRFYF